jgi:hypothetical protein
MDNGKFKITEYLSMTNSDANTHKSIRVEKVENGFVIEVTLDSGKTYYHKRYITFEDPSEELKKAFGENCLEPKGFTKSVVDDLKDLFM